MTFKLAKTNQSPSINDSRRRTNMSATLKPSQEWVPLVVMGGIAVLNLSGHYLLNDAVQSAKSIILAAKAHRICDVLIVATEISGFDPPSVGARHAMVRELAFAADGAVRLAVVLRKEMIDPHKFGVVAAKNFGLTMDVFASEREALAWLRDERD
jgi:hypothetical protein